MRTDDEVTGSLSTSLIIIVKRTAMSSASIRKQRVVGALTDRFIIIAMNADTCRLKHLSNFILHGQREAFSYRLDPDNKFIPSINLFFVGSYVGNVSPGHTVINTLLR